VGVKVLVDVGCGVSVFVGVDDAMTVGESVAVCVSVYAGVIAAGAVSQAVVKASINIRARLSRLINRLGKKGKSFIKSLLSVDGAEI